MTTRGLEAVQSAKSPRDALLRLAALIDGLIDRIDALEEAGGEWDTWPEADQHRVEPEQESPEQFRRRVEEEQHQAALEAMNNANPNEIVLPTPSAQKMERRRLFERQSLRLSTMVGDLTDDEGNDAYAKGGPWWLYNFDRELVMSYPDEIRARMVADIEEDDPQLAHQVSIDILKKPAGEPDFESGAGALAVGYVGGKK